MDSRCGMFYLHDLKLFDNGYQEIKDGSNEFYAHEAYLFKENKFFLHELFDSDVHGCDLTCNLGIVDIMHEFVIWLHMKRLVEIVLGLTRSKKGRNLIFLMLNEILIVELHVIGIKFIFYIGTFVSHAFVSLQGIQDDINLVITMEFGFVEMLEQRDDYTFRLYVQIEIFVLLT